MQSIENNEVMKQILADNFGGIMYNVANRDKYDTRELLALWNGLNASEQESANGLIKGAINFIKGN